MSESKIKKLLEGYYNKTLTEKERKELFALISQPEYEQICKDIIEHLTNWENGSSTETMSPIEANHILQSILSASKQNIQATNKPYPNLKSPVVSINRHPKYRKRSWLVAAAVAGLLLTAGTYFWMQNGIQQQKNDLISINDVQPGKDGAILKLANGEEILLDSLGKGTIGRQGNAEIILQQGMLAYENTSNENPDQYDAKALINTLSTPKGRQFRLMLPDGTVVWLNAASSITFPTNFSDKKREVIITGEVFFEVKPDSEKPFLVQMPNQTRVQVLGTSFNINAYEDEPLLKTTLFSGRIEILNGESSVSLVPGNQAVQKSGDSAIQILKNVNTEEVAAWKNGLFSMRNLDVRALMRQISRWYNIDVQTESDAQFPELRLTGTFSRDVPLADLLGALKAYGIYSKFTDGKLILYPPEE
ncbi:MAG TPA: FecR family protein [Parasegetibacter sp.]